MIMKYLSLFLFVSLQFACFNGKKTTPFFEAGVSVASINPPIGSFIAGDKQNRKFTGIHDSLFAKAVVISNGKSSIAIVTLDCIGLLYPDVIRIREKASALCGFPPERIIVSSTHTHSGPDVVGIWGSDYMHSGVDTSYMNYLVNTAATQIQKAALTKQKVTIHSAETLFGEPWVKNICNEEIDRTVSILQLKNEKGLALATLTNFACHPTFMDARFSQVSADYINGFYKTLTQQTGGEAFFLQGAIGGWVQPEDGEGSFDKAFKRGSELADAVRSALKNSKPFQSNQINFRNRVIKLPVDNIAWKQLATAGIIKRNIKDSVDSELSFFSIGEAQFATHPGETAPYYGLETKKMMVEGPRFVLGLTNDALGYILKPSFFEIKNIPHAEYLTSMSLGKKTAPLMMEHLKELVLDANKE